VLNGIQQPVLVLGIRSDVLYPIHEQQELSNYLGNAQCHRRSVAQVWRAESLNWLRFAYMLESWCAQRCHGAGSTCWRATKATTGF
jgi:hypothetical protein